MSDSGQEKTEQPTPKRLADARKKGQIPRSRELTAAGVMLTAAVALWTFGASMAEGISGVLRAGFTLERAAIYDDRSLFMALQSAISASLKSAAPFYLSVVIAAIVTPALLGGWSFSMKAMAPKLSKLNPLSGIKRVLGPNGLMELIKALAKVCLIGGVAVFMLRQISGEIIGLGTQPVLTALRHAADLMLFALIVVSAPLLIVAAIDAPFQLTQHTKKLKMTRQEVRDESKETDGNPEVKGRQRSLQQEQANRRMMDEVPKADVVITNPTHYAVALRYDPGNMGAPRVVAKGADELARRIRECATEHSVPMMSAPPLARALYSGTELNEEIPARLYAAVAQVLTWVFQLRQADTHGAHRPAPPIIDFEQPEVPGANG
ncbi:MAG: flagellar biosynthesis protein FlhB [Gammaproteobacteria bacterium]